MMKLFLPITIICLGLAPFVGRAQSDPAAPAGPAIIRPTVTREMGDVGGTFFGQPPDPAKVRRYFIAAEPEQWDYAPTGRDELCGGTLPPPLEASRQARKLRYVQYTDETFSARVFPNPSLGIMGPVLRGVVGDYLVVTFLNRIDQPLSMHPHGVKYDKDSEGAYYKPAPGRGAAVGPGAKFTYVWHLDAASGPLPEEPSSKGWLYHSHVTGDDEINLGLVGALIVTDPKRARPDGTPADVDREFATLFLIFDESGLGAEAKEAYEYVDNGSGIPMKSWAEIQQLVELNSRYAINGFVFGNLPGLEMNEGERTRWYLFGLGDERDMHTAHWHGLRVVESRRRTDVVELLPASMKVADLTADNPGTWLFHCHVAEHMTEGMTARMVVHARDLVGVSRAPADSFLGLGTPSLRITRAELAAGSPLPAARPGELMLEGRVTVFEGFSVFTQSIEVQLGEKSFTFKPNLHGEARVPGGFLQVKNGGSTGVIPAGVMEFELRLQGLAGLGGKPAAPAPLLLRVGEARHHATVNLVRQDK